MGLERRAGNGGARACIGGFAGWRELDQRQNGAAFELAQPLHPQPAASMAPTSPTAPTLNPPPPAVGTSGPRTPPTPPGAPSPDAPAPSESLPGAQPPSAASAAADVTRSADRRAVDEPISLPDSTPVFGLVSSRFGRTVSHVGHATHETHATTTQGTPPTTTTTGNTGVSPDNSPDAPFLSTHRLIDSP